MERIVTDSAGLKVPQQLVAITNIAGSIIDSFGGAKLSDIILTDDSGTQFLARDDGTTLTYITLAGAPYTPTTNIRAVAVAGGATSAKQDTQIANFGATTDTHATWYDTTSKFMSRIALMLAALVDAGSHVYGYNGSGQLVTDAWALFGTTRTKTYTYTGSNMTAESDWV